MQRQRDRPGQGGWPAHLWHIFSFSLSPVRVRNYGPVKDTGWHNSTNQSGFGRSVHKISQRWTTRKLCLQPTTYGTLPSQISADGRIFHMGHWSRQIASAGWKCCLTSLILCTYRWHPSVSPSTFFVTDGKNTHGRNNSEKVLLTNRPV